MKMFLTRNFSIETLFNHYSFILQLANILKKYEKLIFANTGQNEQNELLRFLMNELAKMTGKDAIRKLIIK